MKTNTFMDELPMLIISALAIVAIVVLLALHVATVDSFIIAGFLLPIAYFCINGLIRLNTNVSGQQLTTQQVQQLAQTLSGVQAPAQPVLPPAAPVAAPESPTPVQLAPQPEPVPQ